MKVSWTHFKINGKYIAINLKSIRNQLKSIENILKSIQNQFEINSKSIQNQLKSIEIILKSIQHQLKSFWKQFKINWNHFENNSKLIAINWNQLKSIQNQFKIKCNYAPTFYSGSRPAKFSNYSGTKNCLGGPYTNQDPTLLPFNLAGLLIAGLKIVQKFGYHWDDSLYNIHHSSSWKQWGHYNSSRFHPT